MFKIIVKKLGLLVIALQVLNVSIDHIDFNPITNPNNISQFNYFNSFVEYITEYSLGHMDVFKEFCSNHPKKSNLLKIVHFSGNQYLENITLTYFAIDLNSVKLPSISNYTVSKGFTEGIHKPPNSI